MISKLFPVLAFVVLVNPLALDLGLNDLVDIDDRRDLELDVPAGKRDDGDNRIRDMIRCSRTQNCAFFGTTLSNPEQQR